MTKMNYKNYEKRYWNILANLHRINSLPQREIQLSENEKMTDKIFSFLDESGAFDEWVKDLSKEELISVIKEMTTFNFNYVNNFKLNIKES